MIKTRLTDILHVPHPIMLAGMGGVSYAKLVAAVNEAGGFGTFGAGTMSPEQLVAEIRAYKELSDKPYGVDLLTPMGGAESFLEPVIKEGGMSVFVAALGVPLDIIDMCHKAGVLVVNMCGKVKHAVQAVGSGCDIVVAQGTEAGGHTGQVATFPLVPQIVDAVGDKVPVVAAGGIYDGRHLAAALTLGADGVWVGTRFIATPEARSTPGYKEKMLETAEDGTIITRAYTGKTLRAIRNSYNTYFEQHPEELSPFPQQMLRSTKDQAMHLGGDEWTEVDPDKECYPAGQGVGAIRDIRPAGEIVASLVAEAEAALARAAKLTGVATA